MLDTSTNTVNGGVVLGAIPGQIALAPDGSRAYVGIQHVWVNTGYGAAFIPGRSVAVIDTITSTRIASIDLGAAGAAWTLQNTAAGIAVAPDRSDIYVSIPRISSVAVINTSTNVVRQLTPVPMGPNGLAVVPDGSTGFTPYVIDAVNDSAPFSLSSAGGTAVANVLANDRFGGVVPTLAHVALSQQSSTDARITLDPSLGSVVVGAGAATGDHSLVYRICEIADPLNCDAATATVTVIPKPIDAVDDSGASTRAGGLAVFNVLANDRFAGAAATLARVALSQVSTTNAGVKLTAVNGAVLVAAVPPSVLIRSSTASVKSRAPPIAIRRSSL